MRIVLTVFLFVAAGLQSLRSEANAASPRRSTQIRRFADRWLGTRSQWGGTGLTGIDCSAYLRQMYRDVFSVELPRTTRQQIHLGVDVTVNPQQLGRTLSPGDLIFYVDKAGVPNHVVVYMGGDRITHSVSGRGVVIEPLNKVYGRRIVARRLLLPGGSRRGPQIEPIPAAGPIVAVEIPCPPSFVASVREVRRWSREPIEDMRRFGDRAICDFKALARALHRKKTKIATYNAKLLDGHASWLTSIEALKGAIGRGW
ncbi:MAG: C40 family peptidase [Myxococcota bacterium]